LGPATCEYVCTGEPNSARRAADQNPQVPIRGRAAHRPPARRRTVSAENSKENGPPRADRILFIDISEAIS
jgi:hypothetical protein